MATQAEKEGRPVRSVIEDRVKQQREEKEAKDFEEMPEHRHTFHTATHRTGFTFQPWKYLGGFLFMCLAPFILFCGIGVLFIMIYYQLPWITLFIVLCIGALSALLLLSGAMDGSLDRVFLGFLFLLATTTGTIAGMANYHEQLFHYWSASEGRHYTNVRSDSLAAAHGDAGVMVFTDDAVVDTTKTIGYKSGNVYCVAPITRRDQTTASTIQYWAAGTDCCNGRGFFSCDDALDKAAKSGLVIREQPASALFKSEVDYYFHAMEMAAEIYGLTAAKEPFFIRWTTDVGAKAESYFITGWTHWGYYGIAHLLCNFILAALLQGVLMQSKNKKSQEKDVETDKEREPLLRSKGPAEHRKERQRLAEESSFGPEDVETANENFVDNRPTPTFAHGLETLEQPYPDDSIATRYGGEAADQTYYQGMGDPRQTRSQGYNDARQPVNSYGDTGGYQPYY